MQATYTLEAHAEDKEGAMLAAYKNHVPAASLHDIEKDVVKVVRMSQTPQKVTLTVEVDNTGKVAQISPVLSSTSEGGWSRRSLDLYTLGHFFTCSFQNVG